MVFNVMKMCVLATAVLALLGPFHCFYIRDVNPTLLPLLYLQDLLKGKSKDYKKTITENSQNGD